MFHSRNMSHNIHFRKANQTLGRPINIFIFFVHFIIFNKIVLTKAFKAKTTHGLAPKNKNKN